MKQCDYCGNYGEGLETVTIQNYYSDGTSETIDLCPEHLDKLDKLYPLSAPQEQPEPPLDPNDMSDDDYRDWLHDHGAL